MAQTSSASDSLRPDRPRHGSVGVAGITLAADCAGALYWPEEGLLVVADLHLEKGSSFARRGQLLPPYDTTETLARLARLIAHYAPRVVITLGDNFHDGGGHARLSPHDRASLTALQRGRDWIWITGNHDPDPAEGIGGSFGATLSFGTLSSATSRRAMRRRARSPGICIPVARIVQRGRAVSRRCFATDGKRAGDAGLRRLYRRAQRARPRLRGRVRRAQVHRAHAGRQSALCLRGVALPFGLSAPGP